jgi:hypothetical protein
MLAAQVVLGFAILALAVWAVVWVNRRVRLSFADMGLGGRLMEVSLRAMISCITIIVVTTPLGAIGQVLLGALD